MRALGRAVGRLSVILLMVAPLLMAGVVFLSRLPAVASPTPGSDNLFVFLAYAWTGIFVHEAGHAVAGTLMGFRLSVFRVTPLAITVEGNGQTRVAWHGKLGGGYLGLPKHERNLSARTILITAGGPLANVLTFLGCWLTMGMAHGTLTGAGFAFVRGLMIFSLFSAVLNLAPFEFGQSKTDGRRLYDAAARQVAHRSGSGGKAAAAAGIRPMASFGGAILRLF